MKFPLTNIVKTSGNCSCHVILGGGEDGPNYDQKLFKNNLEPSIVIDCSHGNFSRNHKLQPVVADGISEQLTNTAYTGDYITGVMIESNLVEGPQDIPPEGLHDLVYGQSVTAACISWEDTVKTLNVLKEGVRARRAEYNKPFCSIFG